MMFTKIEHYSLMAIPMFILAGNLLSKGSAATRIIEFAKSIVGHLPGGLPISAIFASIIFAAVSEVLLQLLLLLVLLCLVPLCSWIP